jgi:hypothetical protein
VGTLRDMTYILTLDFIKQHCENVQGEWDGDNPGLAEERAQTATEILEKVKEIEELMQVIL